MALLVIQPVFFQHHRQPQSEHFQTEYIPVAVCLHVGQIPELMGYSELTAIARNCAIQRATDALREALLSWLAKGEKINYSVQDSDILTAIGFRPDAASVDDSREKFTPAQNMIFSRKSAQLASRQSV